MSDILTPATPATGFDASGDFALAMAYIPWQTFRDSYEPERALMVGTIFPELDKPFTGKRGNGR